MENIYIVVSLVLIGYVALYFSGRKYLETFQNQAVLAAPTQDVPVEAQDSYELNAIYQNQGSKTASKEQLNAAMTRYPLDWSVQGPASQVFQEGQVQYETQQKLNPSKVEAFQDMQTDMLLPDASTLDDEERKILQTYKPESSKGLLHYSMHDVTHLLEKLYDRKGLIPVIEKSQQGQNIWEIVEVKEKNPKIEWEDDTTHARDIMTERREEVIQVPYTASDVAAGIDPFMGQRVRVRTGGFDNENSELGRMFQPMYNIPAWQ